MKTAILRAISVAFCVVISAAPVRAQQLIDHWLVRASATPDALAAGATAVFRNPAALSPSGRGEALLMDLRGPEISGITGMALAGAYRLDARTTIAAGFQHIGIGDVERTEESPDGGTMIDIGQDLFAAAVAHSVAGFRIGASAQYARSSEILNEKAAVRLGIGLHYALPFAAVPVTVAGTAQSQDETTLWSAALRAAPRLPFEEWGAGATYGAAGVSAGAGVSHRLTAHVVWRELITLEGGAVREPESGGHSMTAIGSIGVRVNRYELGVVRESLANAFGAVHTFRIGILF